MESGSRPAPEFSGPGFLFQKKTDGNPICIFPSFLVEAMIHAGAEEHYPLSLKHGGVSLRD